MSGEHELVEHRRDTYSILFTMISGEAFASLAAAELRNLCVCLETMAKIEWVSTRH